MILHYSIGDTAKPKRPVTRVAYVDQCHVHVAAVWEELEQRRESMVSALEAQFRL